MELKKDAAIITEEEMIDILMRHGYEVKKVKPRSKTWKNINYNKPVRNLYDNYCQIEADKDWNYPDDIRRFADRLTLSDWDLYIRRLLSGIYCVSQISSLPEELLSDYQDFAKGFINLICTKHAEIRELFVENYDKWHEENKTFEAVSDFKEGE